MSRNEDNVKRPTSLNKLFFDCMTRGITNSDENKSNKLCLLRANKHGN